MLDIERAIIDRLETDKEVETAEFDEVVLTRLILAGHVCSRGAPNRNPYWCAIAPTPEQEAKLILMRESVMVRLEELEEEVRR